MFRRYEINIRGRRYILKADGVTMDEKPWYLSKTVWINVLLLVVSICDALLGSPLVSGTPVADHITSVVSAVNLVLRFLTVAPLGK